MTKKKQTTEKQKITQKYWTINLLKTRPKKRKSKKSYSPKEVQKQAIKKQKRTKTTTKKTGLKYSYVFIVHRTFTLVKARNNMVKNKEDGQRH